MTYKKLDLKDIEYLKSIVSEDRVYIGDDINEDFSHDELSEVHKYPDIVIEALSADEVSKIMKYANENKIPVVARGSGTGLVGGAVAVHGGILISLQKMNRILELDENNFTLTLEPGVLLMEIAEYLTEKGLFYPPDPGEKTATIGGNISTNAGGMRAVKYGVTRDYVRYIEVVLPNGEIIELGGKIVKNSSGYSLKDIIVGSEGTLGIVTKASLKILPIPQKSISLLIPFNDIDGAISSVPKIMMTKTMPTAVEFMEKQVIVDAENFLGKKFPDKSGDAFLLLSYDGSSRDEIEKGFQDAVDICFENGAIDVFLVDTDERKDSVWIARGAFLEAIKASTTEMDECDVVVPKNHVAEFVNFTYDLSKKYDIRIKNFGHAGDGNLHVYVLKDELKDEEWKVKLKNVFDELYEKAKEFDGKVSGEHGIGYAKRSYLKTSESPQVLELMRGIKKVFDPNNILNPDKVVM